MSTENQPQFKVGDKVSWVHYVVKGSRISMSHREGVITHLSGRGAFLKMRNGREAWQLFEDLTPDGEKNALTKAFFGSAKEEGK